MKKKLLATVLISTMVLSMTACGEKGTSESSGVTKNNSEKQSVEKTTENSKDYWILKQDFGTPSTSFEGTLFNDQVVLPLELSAIDAYAAPYKVFPNSLSMNKFEPASINEVLTSDVMMKCTKEGSFGGPATKVHPQSGSVEVSQFDENYCGLGTIFIDNFSENDEELPISTCCEKGWWSISANENFDHARFLQVEPGTGVNDKELLSNIVKKFGTPTYIASRISEYSSLDEFFASIKDKDSLNCNLIYEYDDFVLDIDFMEVCVGKNYDCEIWCTSYYPSTYWEVKKEDYKTLISMK